MARVLVINPGSEGHINPTLSMVRELIRRGEEVVYFTTEQFRPSVEATGARVISCDGAKFIEAFLAGGRSPWGRVGGLLHTADVVIPSLLEQTKAERFDYIIHDALFGCGRLVAQLLGLPAISSCTSFALQERTFDSMQTEAAGQFPAEENKRAQAEFEQLARNIEMKYKVQVGSAYEVFCNPAHLNIVYTSKQFQPDGESFDGSYKFVGPSISIASSSPSHAEFDFSGVDLEQLIYISLGTVFNHSLDFYKLCFEAFGQTKYSVILSIGRQISFEELGEVPANFVVARYVPQLEVLQKAKLFITHGGMNSTSEGLYFGVPLVVVPQSADQPVVARRVAELGAGIELLPVGLTAQGLRTAAERVLEDASIRQASVEMGELSRTAGGYPRAVEEIFIYTRSLGLAG